MSTTSTRPVLAPRDLAALPTSRPVGWGRWAAGIVIAVFAASAVVSVLTNPHLDYGVVWRYFFSASILQGLWLTVVMSVLAMALGIVLGVLLSVAKLSANRVLSSVANVYIWFFRGVPLLVQMLIWGNLALLFPQIGFGVPFTYLSIVGIDTNAVVTPFIAAILALGLHEAAYMAEVVRGGILAVGAGQAEACAALGMTGALGMRRVILPQATRVIIPPTGNQFISLIKASSMVSVIAGGDLLTAAENISSINYRTIDLLLVATGWYLVVISILSIGQHFLERKFARGTRR